MTAKLNWPVMAQDELVVHGAREHNQGRHRPPPAAQADCVTGLGLREASLAFDTIYAEGQRRYGVALRLRPPVPPDDGEARRGLDRRPQPRDLHRPEDDLAKPQIHRGHGHGDLRLPAPALRASRPPALPDLRPSHRRPVDRGDRRPDPAASPRAPASRSMPPSSATGRADKDLLDEPAATASPG